jgi:hypothetical protein
MLPGIIGYEESVIPQLENAILSGQDVIFLGERGQAKSRITRALVSLLDEYVPAIADCEISDNPFDPICKQCRDRIAELGDKTPIEWIHRDQRYGEKLATPDSTIADFIGEVDPIKVADPERRTIHYGDPAASSASTSSPDLAERIGRSAEHHGRARRADPRLSHPAAARHHGRRERQPGGLHEPRPYHYATARSLRRADPHALPALRGARDQHHGAGDHSLPGRPV